MASAASLQTFMEGRAKKNKIDERIREAESTMTLVFHSINSSGVVHCLRTVTSHMS